MVTPTPPLPLLCQCRLVTCWLPRLGWRIRRPVRCYTAILHRRPYIEGYYFRCVSGEPEDRARPSGGVLEPFRKPDRRNRRAVWTGARSQGLGSRGRLLDSSGCSIHDQSRKLGGFTTVAAAQQARLFGPGMCVLRRQTVRPTAAVAESPAEPVSAHSSLEAAHVANRWTPPQCNYLPTFTTKQETLRLPYLRIVD